SSNRIQSLPGCVPTYDANGNLTYDCVHNYTWNSDGRPVTIDTTAVTYDAFGHMVEKNVSGTFTEYLYSPGGKLGTMNGQTTQVVTIPLPGGASVIHNDTISTIRFRHADWLGSIRATSTLWNRTLVGETAWAPYGESYRASSNPPTSFTGLRPDTAPDLQDALYRSYSPVQGRWLSPDPAGLGAADLANPQSWNRYAYVNNNPLSLVDPSGLECLQTKGDTCDPFGPGFSDFGFDLFGGFGRLCWR